MHDHVPQGKQDYFNDMHCRQAGHDNEYAYSFVRMSAGGVP
ncbi:hypothetical protein [Nitrosomonas sp. Nm51]|nr:hypothetical protein [Nitrosomonas sp. Nm51]